MRRFAVSLIIIVAAMSGAAAGAAPKKQDILVYRMPIHYQNSTVKSKTTVDGIYVYYGVGSEYSVEAEYDRIGLKYVNGKSYRQRDFTAVYNSYSAKDGRRIGIHSAKSSTLTDNDLTLFFGTRMYGEGGKSTGLDLFSSTYSKYSPRLKVYQLTGSFNRAGSKGKTSSTKLYYIRMGRRLAGMSRDYYSVEEALTFKRGRTTYGVNGWAGKQAFAVRGDGFIVFNTPETHKGGYGAFVNFALHDDMNLKLFGAKEMFSDYGTSNHASSSQFGVSVTKTY